MQAAIADQSVSAGRNTNSGLSSMNLVMSQGQATRSTFTFSRVIHFMIQPVHQVTERLHTPGLLRLQNLASELLGRDAQPPAQTGSCGHLSRSECERSPDSEPAPVAARRGLRPRRWMRTFVCRTDRT